MSIRKLYPLTIGFNARLTLSLCAGLALLPAQAQTATDITAAPRVDPVFAIRGFDISGDNPLSGEQTNTVLAPFLRSQANLETLQQATTALEAALRDKGYGLHRVAVPPQELGTSVKLNVVKFVIGAVSVVGAENFSQANVRASLPELREGGAPNFQRLAVQTAIANESQSKQVQVVLKASAEPDKIDADINVKDSRPWNWSAALSNNGSAATGRDRLVLAGSHANVLDRDHQVDAAYTTSMAKPGDVRQYGLNYRIPLYALGGVLGFSHTHSDVSGNFASFSSSGAGQTLGLSYNLYLPPVGGYRSWVSAGLEDKQFDITQINGAPLPGQALRRSRPLSLRYSARLESDKALLTYDAELALNGPGGQGNSLADYQSEDPRIAVNRWKLLRANASYSASLGVGWLWSARAQLQYSADALISGEQFGLGGTSSVRGTEERPLSGDRGLSLGLEFSTPELQPGLRVVGFIDGGVLSNVVSNGTNKPNSDHLASAGLGLRYVAGKVSATADWGRVFVGSVVPTSVTNMAPQVGNQKMHVNITGRF